MTLNKTVIKRHCLSGLALFKSIALCKYLVLSIIYHSADLGISCKFHHHITDGNEYRSVTWPVLHAHTVDSTGVGRGSHLRNSRQDGSAGPFPGYHHSHQSYTLDALSPFAYIFFFLSWCYDCFCNVSLLGVNCSVVIGLAYHQVL